MKRVGQLELKFGGWGGARKGAGRPPNGGVAGVSHRSRPWHSRHHPLHVTLRVAGGVPSLRGGMLFGRVRGALAEGQERFGFRVVQFSVQSNHLHLIAEAADRGALSRGMQGLSIRVARAVNGQLGRRGVVFADRYHARALKTPRATHFALRYVLLNARKHQRGGRGGWSESSAVVPAGYVDPCSSAAWFAGFERPTELVFGAARLRQQWRACSEREAPVARPRTWLLRQGWRGHGFDVDDIPG